MQTLNLSASRSWQRAFGLASTSLALLGLTVAPAVLATSIVEAAPKDIEARLYLGKSIFKKGEVIPVALRATNTDGKKTTLNFPSGQRYEFKVFRKGENNPVYVWSADKLFIAQAGTVEIKAGKTQQYSDQLAVGELQPGKYRLEGMLTSNPLIVAPSVSFEIAGMMSDNPIQPDVKLVAKTDKKNYALGEAIKIDFALSNPDMAAALLKFKSGQQYDVFVRDNDGDLVWNWSANKKFLMAALPMTLQAGETKNYSETWNQEVLPGNKPAKLKPGKYTIHVVFESQPRIKADPINIKIN